MAMVRLEGHSGGGGGLQYEQNTFRSEGKTTSGAAHSSEVKGERRKEGEGEPEGTQEGGESKHGSKNRRSFPQNGGLPEKEKSLRFGGKGVQ